MYILHVMWCSLSAFPRHKSTCAMHLNNAHKLYTCMGLGVTVGGTFYPCPTFVSCITGSILGLVQIQHCTAGELTKAHLILPDVLDLVLPARFRPMPGLISSTVSFSNVIFVQLSHNFSSNYTMQIYIHEHTHPREGEMCGSVDRYTHTYMYITISSTITMSVALSQCTCNST